MNDRFELHDELLKFVDNAYFQPPENIKIQYPCIIYNLKNIDTRKANDILYKKRRSYDVTLITKDPDTKLVDDILETFKYSRFDRHFVSDNLNHYAFSIYY